LHIYVREQIIIREYAKKINKKLLEGSNLKINKRNITLYVYMSLWLKLINAVVVNRYINLIDFIVVVNYFLASFSLYKCVLSVEHCQQNLFLFAFFSYWFLNYFLSFFQFFDKLEKRKKSAGHTCWLPFYFLSGKSRIIAHHLLNASYFFLPCS
jgi:hypothetical protein